MVGPPAASAKCSLISAKLEAEHSSGRPEISRSIALPCFDQPTAWRSLATERGVGAAVLACCFQQNMQLMLRGIRSRIRHNCNLELYPPEPSFRRFRDLHLAKDTFPDSSDPQDKASSSKLPVPDRAIRSIIPPDGSDSLYDQQSPQ